MRPIAYEKRPQITLFDGKTMSIMTGQKESKNKADKIGKSEKSYGNLIKYKNCQITDKKVGMLETNQR
ncbi:hypothetical protein T4D_7847 [Trichinella pseudospiralis]|uniref:Uncharacterized protein n=1 Tax=Trichinella pseudospiralis TaxID=6337 RepID=A0A0V1FJ29_TRIPS|nr:hypothetical protein T4D_7847 [Trichinella pseudospiralis]